jgi:hypothetical protein
MSFPMLQHLSRWVLKQPQGCPHQFAGMINAGRQVYAEVRAVEPVPSQAASANHLHGLSGPDQQVRISITCSHIFHKHLASLQGLRNPHLIALHVVKTHDASLVT